MVKHVYYKKASDCTWHLLSKMERQTKLSRRREQDRKRKHQARQDQLMAGYIHVKYPLIYKEANEFYQTLNNMYPNKIDLRKTARFKELEVDIINPSIQPDQTTYNDNMILKIPLIGLQANEPNEPDCEKAPEETFNHQYIIPENIQHVDGIFPTIDEIPENKEAVDAIFPTIDEIPENKEAVDAIFPTIDEIPENKEAVDAIFPTIAAATLIDELPPDLIQNIINELRADPDLQSTMNEIEDQINDLSEKDLDIDIDIADDLLEKELSYR